MYDLAQWIIVAMAIAGLVFNTGVLYNDIKHLKKSVDDVWKEINHIKTILIGDKSKTEREKE